MYSQETQDSISAAEQVEAGAQNYKKHSEPTPAEILSWLPKSATPEQQDSAIQAHIKQQPIHWSSEPDTLHMPGFPKGKSMREVSLPQYYRESYFSKSPMFHPELQGGRVGVAGDPIPYTIAGDNVMTAVLIACFVLTLLTLARFSYLVGRQFKSFFYSAERDADTTETTGEYEFQLLLGLQSCLLMSMVFFFYTNSPISGTFIVQQYSIIGIFTAIIAAYFLIKSMIYGIVNITFFGGRKNLQWMRSFLFIAAMEGIFLFPAVMLLAYFDMSVKTVFIYSVAVVGLFKFLAFCKSYSIFFAHRRGGLQNILYFCALEVVPLAALWGFLQVASEYLKVNI
jgi:hypothetical protein